MDDPRQISEEAKQNSESSMTGSNSTVSSDGKNKTQFIYMDDPTRINDKVKPKNAQLNGRRRKIPALKIPALRIGSSSTTAELPNSIQTRAVPSLMSARPTTMMVPTI